jgi:transcriptional regulator with XRE-family HTH domain
MDAATSGGRLRAVRESSGFTQEQVATYLGVKRESISSIETGARPVSTGMLPKLADLYGYKAPHFLVDDAEDAGPRLAIAFRVSDLQPEDLSTIAEVRKIASNLDSLYRLLEE